MFTLDQISQAHSKVKSGADFPNYIKELKQLGVVEYETFVFDGHTEYLGINERNISSTGKYEPFSISETSSIEQFKADLKAHQQGKTDYLTFCNDCAKSGIEKWVVNLTEMTCTYYDKSGKEILREIIPQ